MIAAESIHILLDIMKYLGMVYPNTKMKADTCYYRQPQFAFGNSGMPLNTTRIIISIFTLISGRQSQGFKAIILNVSIVTAGIFGYLLSQTISRITH